MVKAKKAAVSEDLDPNKACLVCEKVRKLIGELCTPCRTRLKVIINSKGKTSDSMVADAIRAGNARRRQQIEQKWVRSASSEAQE